MKASSSLACVLVFFLFATGSLLAQGPRGLSVTPAEFEARLGYQTGTISLRHGMATLRLPQSFRYIGPEGSRRLLTEAWGNPPAVAQSNLGMLIPTAVSPLSREGWGIVIEYEEEGFVNDDDAASIDYTRLLKQMQDATVAVNGQREKQGFEPVTLIGWAEQPSYDAAAHKMYWAKELAFGTNSNHTLNYNIRVLGRRGVLVLNAVAEMDRLPAIRRQTRDVLAAVDFNEGDRYSDYLPGTDKAAAYGITGLIIGATAAKGGMFKVLIAGLLAFKKAVIMGFFAAVAAIRRFFGRRSPQAPPESVLQ